jgi:uncharacterized protein (DUF4415 family)
VSKYSSKRKSKTDWTRVDAMSDDDIDYSEIPEQNESFFQTAILRMPQTKAIVTLRLDRDVLEWFKRKGSGYQTRINALLKAYMEAQKEISQHRSSTVK